MHFSHLGSQPSYERTLKTIKRSNDPDYGIKEYKMKVELSIADDRELKQHIRDVIKGEVLSIARGEVKDIIAQAVGEKAIPGSAADIEKLVKAAIKEEIVHQLGAKRYGSTTWIKTEARKQIAEMIRNWATTEHIDAV